jgi:hypothetical protein
VILPEKEGIRKMTAVFFWRLKAAMIDKSLWTSWRLKSFPQIDISRLFPTILVSKLRNYCPVWPMEELVSIISLRAGVPAVC